MTNENLEEEVQEDLNEEASIEDAATGDETVGDALRSAFDEAEDETPLAEGEEDPSEPVEAISKDKPNPDAEANKAPSQVGSAPIVPPASMKAEAKEQFYSLPREHQEFLAKEWREMRADYGRKTAQVAEKARESDEIQQAIKPYEKEFALQGLTKGQVVNHLLAFRDYLQKEPDEAFRWLAAQNNYDLSRLTNPSRGEYQVSPEIRQLSSQVQSLQQQLQGVNQQRQQATVQTFQQQVDHFKSQVDQQGNPARPFYDQVENEIALQIPIVAKLNPGAAPQQILDLAYQRAINVVPDVREAIQRSTRENSAAAQKAEAHKRALRAKKAGSSITGAPGGSSATRVSADQSVRGQLEHAWGGNERL